MKTNILKLSAWMLIGFLFLSSCKKEDTEPVPTATNQTQNLTLKFNPVVGAKPLDFSSTFQTDSGVRYTLSMFRYYVSNIRLVKNDGSEFAIAGKYLLVTPSVADYDLGQVPVADYKGLKFDVGLDSATNHKDPTLYPVTNPLAIQSPAIHWSWNSGYIFMMVEGSCDTTALQNDVLTYGQFSKSMFFHVGTDALKRQIDLMASYSVASSSAKVLTIKADANKLFGSVDLKTDNQSHTMGSMPLATKVANNIQSVFTIVP